MDSIHFVRGQESLVKGSLSLGIYAVLLFIDNSKGNSFQHRQQCEILKVRAQEIMNIIGSSGVMLP